MSLADHCECAMQSPSAHETKKWCATKGSSLNATTSAETWIGVADCLNCSIRQSVLFAQLQEGDFRELHRLIEQLFYAAGSTIYLSGAEGLSLFTVRKGLVKLTQDLSDGTKRIVRLLGKTDVLGVECMYGTEYQHSASLPKDVGCRPKA
jgi:CRP/FNR family transcriptional regulator, anaerobic regulatory protein